MKYSEWEAGDYPVYIDPTFQEIVELAKARPDTLRIMDGEDHFAVASGFGNTHSSVCKAVAKVLGVKLWLNADDYILYREYGQWYFNPMGHWHTNSVRVKWDSNLVCLTDRGMEFIKDFIQIWEECESSNTN